MPDLSENAQVLGVGGKVGPHPLVGQVQQVTTACGALVQAIKRLPGVDVEAADKAGKEIGHGIMALLKTMKRTKPS